MDFINEQDRANTLIQAVTGRLEYPPDLGGVRIGRAELNEFVLRVACNQPGNRRLAGAGKPPKDE